MPPALDIKGKRFGRLVVIGRAAKATRETYRNAMWECKCDCGKIAIAPASNLVSGDVVSCGCFLRENNSRLRTTHGASLTSEFKTWRGIKDRCANPNSSGWIDYGGRGIKVCQRWLDSFENFLADMGPKPSKNHSIERIDFNGDYRPDNCKWATKREQSRNRRDIRLIESDGEKLCLLDWANKLGVKRHAIYRLLKRGMEPSDAIQWIKTKGRSDTVVFSVPPGREPKLITYGKKTMSVSNWAHELEVSKPAIYNLLKKGKTGEEAIAQISARQARSAWLRSQIKV